MLWTSWLDNEILKLNGTVNQRREKEFKIFLKENSFVSGSWKLEYDNDGKKNRSGEKGREGRENRMNEHNRGKFKKIPGMSGEIQVNRFGFLAKLSFWAERSERNTIGNREARKVLE